MGYHPPMITALLLACSLTSAPELPAPEPAERVTIRSDPPGAVVFLDGERIGSTPVELEAGSLQQRVELRANGFAPASGRVPPEGLMVRLEPGCAQLVDYQGRFASDPALEPVDVAGLPAEQLPLLRNEIFARYGRAFQTPRYAQHFASQPWYEVNPHYREAVLSENDRANAALIRSFEGQAARERVLEVGEYVDPQGSGLMFVDAHTVELLDGSAGIYDWDRQTRRWIARGEWILTWEGPEQWSAEDPAVKESTLWELDHTTGRVQSSTRLKTPRV